MGTCGLKRNKTLKSKLGIIISIVLVFIILICFYYFKVVCPIIEKLAGEKVKAITTSIATKAVGDVMINDDIQYDDLVKIKYNANNEIELIEINSVRVNVIIHEITKQIQDEIADLGSGGISIALGTFSGIPFLYDVGPNLSIKLVQVGVVNTKLDSEFSSAGINQTLHKLSFEVSANVALILPIKNRIYNTSLEVLLCESVIVGKVPQIYMNN